MEESKKRKHEELGADEETPAKVAATETDSETEDYFSNIVNSDMSNGEEDPMINILQFFLHKNRAKGPGSANISRRNPAAASDKKHRSPKDHCLVFSPLICYG